MNFKPNKTHNLISRYFTQVQILNSDWLASHWSKKTQKKEIAETEYLDDRVTQETCLHYPKSKWIDCYCKPSGPHTTFITAISCLAFIFVIVKFATYFHHKYKKSQRPKSVRVSLRYLSPRSVPLK